ncbi:hypothetical protein, partial [Segatella copri]|uniref:hypothetical protein n=1 Tax=Segatella copri TaxID=165179 RepID=UPI001D17ABFC
MIYLILILLFLFPVYACDYKLWNYGNSYERGNTYKGYYFFLYIVVVLFLGLRNYVGGDTIGYMDMWKKIRPVRLKSDERRNIISHSA